MKAPVLAMMSSADVADHLWSGDRSVAKRAVVGASTQLATPPVGVGFGVMESDCIASGCVDFRLDLICSGPNLARSGLI